MTDTQMVMVPLVATDEMQNIKQKFTCGGYVTYQDIYDAMVQASPNAGKVTPEMLESIVFNVRKIAIEYELDQYREKYSEDCGFFLRVENDLKRNVKFNDLIKRMSNEVIKALGLEVEGE